MTKTKTASRRIHKAAAPAPEPVVPAPRQTKQQRLVALLREEGGATIADLSETLGWLPHTTRAAITMLKKAGHTVERTKQPDGGSSYRIVAPVAAHVSPELADATAHA